MSKLLKTTIFVMLTLLLFSLIFLVGTTPAYALSPEDLIDNSINSPFIIDTKQDFLDLTYLVNTGSNMQGKYFLLGTDLDLTMDVYAPIGNSLNSFQGNFDGGNHTVTINVITSSTYTGLFGYIGNSGVVKNVVVSGSLTASNYLGGIAGYNAGSIINCINNANLTVATAETFYVGGICGENIGKIDSCVNAGNITANKYCGGITGKNLSTTQGIFSSVNLGNIAVTSEYTNATRMGGLVGESKAIISNSYNYAFVNATGDRIGALVGYLTGAPVGSVNCYNITSKSARDLIGKDDVTMPSTFLAKTNYNFLEKTVVFAENTMRNLDFIQGYGFLSYPKTLNENAVIKDKIKICLFGNGNGETATPFTINDINQWQLFAVNSLLFDYENMEINLSFDINLGQTQPLFSQSNPFRGIFDGKLHSITVNLSGVSNVGLFTATDTGTIKNLTINGTVNASANNAGAVVGVALGGAIQNITNNCNVTAKNYVGGIVGQSISGLLSLANVKNYGIIRGESQIGGIIGEGASVAIIDSENYGDILATTSSINNNIGGIAGKISSDGTLNDVFNSGEVSAYKATNVGGIVGYAKDSSFFKVANVNNVKGKNNVGGICGYSLDTIENFYNINGAMCVGTVTGASNVAGILGSATGFAKLVSNSYFVGTLSEVIEATPVPSTFKPISSSTNINNSFFNSDLLPSYAGSSKNSIELTDNVFEVAPTDTVWLANAMSASAGYYPIMKLSALTSNTTLINSKLKINYFSGGSGISNDPYLIANEQTLRNFSFLNNNYPIFNYNTKYYKITNDITLKRPFTTVCTSALPFDGNFDGNYKIINNLNISGGEYTGLFASLGANATVTKLFIESGAITGTNYTGSIAGLVNSGAKISDSYSSAMLITQNSSGGLVGVNYGQIIDSFFAGRITGLSNIGGIAGKNGIIELNKGTITKCFSLGYIVGTGNVGGIVGQNQGDISICQVSGTVHLTADNTYAGGIAGESLKGNTTSCYVIAVITTEATGAKIGGLIGQFTNSGEATLTNCFYHVAISKATTPYYIMNMPWADTSGRIKNTEQMLNTAFKGDLNNQFDFGLAPSKDSDFAPRILSFINTGIERKEFYSAESAKLRVFGWDNTSQDIWGGKQNPYVISTPNQLDTLSRLVATYKYTYTGNYFVLSSDLNMQGINFMPIGRFISASDANNYMFNGNLNGNGHSISNLNVDRTYSYIGLFGYTGSGFALNNLTLNASCSFTTTANFAGSLVGYNGGTIDRCVSYATVIAANSIGGLCAYSAVNTAVTNSVFYGSIPTGVTYSYGILGMITSSGIVVNTNNTWYVYKNNTATNIKATALPYIHNDYGSVLFVDRQGSVEVAIDFETQNVNNIVAFLLSADTYYTSTIMTSNDATNYSGSTFYPYGIFNGSKTVSFVRFCQTARLNFAISEESAYMENYLGTYGSGMFYEGQSVKFTIEIAKGYYLENLPEYATNYILGNESTNLTIRFNMGSSSTGSYYDVPISIKDASSLVSVTCSDLITSNIYDGLAKTIEVTFNGVFDYYTLSYYYGIDKNNVSEIKNAGEYMVYTRIYMIGNHNLFYGIVQSNFTILPYQLILDESPNALSNYWSSQIAVKTYDGSNQEVGKEISNQYLLTIVPTDFTHISVKANVQWTSASAGSNISAVVSGFTITGDRAVNYAISAAITLTLADGKINKNNLIVTIPSSNLSMQYNGSKPIISNPQVSGSLGNTSLVWTFIKLNIDNEPDIVWGNLAIKTYYVGKYAIAVSAEDTNNYAISFGSNSYEYEIIPKNINAIRYSDYENKVYNGSVLSSSIKAVYDTFNSNIDFAILTFYKGSVSEENKITDGVIDAGNYIAVPSIANENFKLSSITPLNFTVAKSNLGGAITYSLNEFLVVHSMSPLFLECDIYDAELIIEVDESSRAKITLLKPQDNYYLLPTAYSTISVQYRIAAINATNYEDRYSSYGFVEIQSFDIYVGVKNREHIFGDIIDLELQYSYDIDQTDILSTIEVEELQGYKASNYQVVYSSLLAGNRYTVNIDGGDFDAYKIKNSNNCFIDVVKRDIKVTVPIEIITNTKVYGNANTTINYFVIDVATNRQMTVLPNGETLMLVGKLSRDIGELVGNYAITQGTLNADNNPNYNITTDFPGEYTISQRPIVLVIPITTKYFGQDDPKVVPQLETGYTLAYQDNINVIPLEITREAGEDCGKYNFNVVSTSSIRNYAIAGIINEGYFEILQGTPSVAFNIQGTLYYGNKISTLKIIGQAHYTNSTVTGIFSWVNANQIATSMAGATATLRFSPSSSNYTIKETEITLPVEKREIDAAFVGEMEYVYNGKLQCNIEAEFINVYNDEEIEAIATINKTPINAGEYVYCVTIDSDKYIIANNNAIMFVIYPKEITVTVASKTILEGETYNLEVTYQGFVEGEDITVLERKAEAGTIPVSPGRRTISVSGAIADNYIFTYISGTLLVNAKKIGDEIVTINGVINPSITISATEYLNKKDIKVSELKIDKFIGASIIKPSQNMLSQYVGIEFNEIIYGDYSYSVVFSQAITEGDLLYALNYGGVVAQIEDYTLSDDGKTVYFTASTVLGVAVYSPKDKVSLIKGYFPLACIGAGLFVVLVVVVIGMGAKVRKNKARKAYLKSLSK